MRQNFGTVKPPDYKPRNHIFNKCFNKQITFQERNILDSTYSKDSTIKDIIYCGENTVWWVGVGL